MVERDACIEMIKQRMEAGITILFGKLCTTTLSFNRLFVSTTILSNDTGVITRS